jgi:phage baseplate assembly protein W
MIIDRQQLFGADLQVTMSALGFDLVGNNLGDLQLARGNDNIVQALTLRLMVRRGELARLGWPDYGSRLHELIGEPNNRRTHLKLMAFARAAIEQDPRVREVSEVRVQLIGGERDTVRLMLEIALIDAPTPLNLVYDLVLEAP